MTIPLIAGVALLVVLVGIWAYAAWRHRPPKPPEPTPWADSTKVARRIREMNKGDDGRAGAEHS